MTRIRARACAIVLCLQVCFSASANGAPSPKTLSIAEYIAQLDTLAAAIDSSAERTATTDGVLEDVPSAWQVESEHRVFEISSDSLRRDLRRWRATHDAAISRRILQRVKTLRSDAYAFQQPPADISAVRALALDILSRGEFRNVRGPTWVDRLRKRMFELINRLFVGVIESSAFPTVSTVLVYLLLGVAGVTAAIWIVRLHRRAGRAEPARPIEAPPSARHWTNWFTEAQSAAADGRWRDAIHLSYWSAVSFLEAKNAWPADRTRTPREYVRLLPPSAPERSALAALTRTFERVWYGTENADADAFAEVTAHLKNLGCLTG